MGKKGLITARLNEFKEVFEKGDDRKIFEELVFCIFTANASAKMALKSVEAVRGIIMDGSKREMSKRLRHAHRFPNARSNYVVLTREYLRREFDFKLRDLIFSFEDPLERRDFFASKDIMGLGYKESSHFLRNIGFRGYAILDKHILQSLYEFGVLDSPKAPITRNRYLETESKFKEFGNLLGIQPDELDLLLWSEKTGEILK
ncbi:MAG: N-glycosylase/DNA lyase [Deltaproteobacteria bacterium]|nr:N-glycosylase/DNA lyase [Deltaproteobacteria bacterium]